MKQTRTSFNGGELDPWMDARCDVDVYMRGCRVLENWELSPLGGVRRRRGMRRFVEADSSSRIFPYIYSYSSKRWQYIVCITPENVKVYNQNAELKADLTPLETFDMSTLHVQQINADMYINSSWSYPCVLRLGSDSTWTLERVSFKVPPWRFVNERRSYPLVLTRKTNSLEVDFSQVTDAEESSLDDAGRIRTSILTQENVLSMTKSEIVPNVQVVSYMKEMTEGAMFAYPGEVKKTAYVCKQEWPKDDVYAKSLSSPECYPDNFEKAEDTSGYTGEIKEVWDVGDLVSSGNVPLGRVFVYCSSYWEYYTCIRSFTIDDMYGGMTKYSDYPEFFRRGIDAGKAIPCKGKWELQVHGSWAGEYAVLRNYETDDLSSTMWEVAGSTVSPIGNATLTPLAGDESDEECYLRLALIRSQRYNGTEISSGFPADNCENRLVVRAYLHDTQLMLTCVRDENYDIVSRVWEVRDTIKYDWTGIKTVWNWSWEAFSSRYGYPTQVQMLGQRLVFASTNAQPQSLWLSQTDDFTNFDTNDSDTSSIAVTLATDSQNPICWMQENRNRLLLGTCQSEFVIHSGDAALTPTSIRAARHDNAGSAPNTVSLLANNKVLFVERGGGRCYAFGYEMESDSYCSRDLTVFAPQVLNDHGGAVRATMLNKPYKVAVFALADGQVALMTYNSEQEVKAWHRWTTDGKVLDVCTLPDEQRKDRLFLLIERDDGTYIEVVDAASGFTDGADSEYVSTLVTNPLGNTLEQEVGKGRAENPHVLLGDTLTVEDTELSCDGENWNKIAQYPQNIPKGWTEFNINTMWRFERVFGIRCSGTSDAVILSVQA